MEEIQDIKAYGRENKIPVLLDESASFFVSLVKKYNPTNVLEIGTAIGYSGSLILTNSDAYLTTLEKNEESYNLAKQNFKDQNLLERVTQILGDGLEECKKLSEQGKKYDFIFLDGPKGQYIYYLPVLLEMLTKDGVLVCDNVLFRGLVRSEEFIPHKKRAMITKLRKFLKEIESREDLDTIVHEIGDGIAEIRRKYGN